MIASPLEWRLRDYAFIQKWRSCENAPMLHKELMTISQIKKIDDIMINVDKDFN